MKNYILIIFLLVSGLTNCNPENIKIGNAVELGDIPSSILQAEGKEDPFQNGLLVEMSDLPGHDDLIFDAKRKIAYASGMDGWIWELDFSTQKAKQWAKPPVNPAGMQYSSAKKDKILVCASRLGGETYAEQNRVGLYEIEIGNVSIQPLVLDLPIAKGEEFEKVYKESERPKILLKDLNPENSRPFSLCNDLAVSKDGNRIFITEPFERSGAAMGSGAVPEAIGLFPHGKLWMYDRKERSLSLLVNGFTFVDGILLEESSNGEMESVLFTETSRFRLIRAFLSGSKQGTSEVVLDNLPGLADGLERDEKGRVWVGVIKPRSKLINFVHRNPWLKSFLLSLPQGILPIAKKTGILVLDAKGSKPLYYFLHDGSKIRDISVSVPFGDRVYFPSFEKASRGLYSVSKKSLGLEE